MYEIRVDGALFCSSKIEDLAVINPVIDLEMNKAGTFTFIVPPNHPGYNTIKRKSSLIDVYRDEELIFEGICSDIEDDFFKQRKISCEGELTFLNDSYLRPHQYQNQTVRQLLEAYIAEHNSLVEAGKRFTVGQVTVTDSNNSLYCFTNYNSTMFEIKEDLIDDLGGFLRVRHESGVRYLDYLAAPPRTSNQVIRLGENLLDLTTSLSADDIATVIIPLGATLDTQTIPGLDERLTIKTAAADTYHPANADYVYSSTAVEEYGWIEKVVTWDDVTTVAALLSKGEAYLSDVQFENMVITAKAVDLGLTDAEFNQFRLLDYIRVVSAPHGLDRYFILSKLQINLNNPEQDTITLGIEEQKTLSAKANAENEKIKREIEQLPTSNMVQSAIDNATALLTGADGGYVVIVRNNDGQPVELRIQDALNNPTKIWRWNQNGFGYSNDGGEIYGLAMTMNGAIVADYITAGTMSAERIRGGDLLIGGSGLAANGSITIKDSNNNTLGTWDKTGIKLYKGTVGGWYITDDALISYDGTGDADSTKKVVLYKYVNTPGAWAFAVYTRNSTSDSWSGKFAITYDGNIVSQEAIDIYPTDSNYGMHIHGALSTDAKIQVGNGNCIINDSGYINTKSGLYSDGTNELNAYGVTARDYLNVNGGGGHGIYCAKGINSSNLLAESRAGEDPAITSKTAVKGTQFVTYSDKRLKRDIKDIAKDKAIAILKDLKPVSFKYITNSKKRVGLVAQDVKKTLEENGLDKEPFLLEVQEESFDDRKFYNLDYSAFIPILVKGYQDQQERIEALEEALKGVNS